MSFTLSYIAKVALALNIIADMMDLSYFGFENNRLLYNLTATILWVTLVNYVFDNNFFSEVHSFIIHFNDIHSFLQGI